MEVKTYMFTQFDENDNFVANYGLLAKNYKEALQTVKRTEKEHGITKRSRVYTQENFFKTPYWDK